MRLLVVEDEVRSATYLRDGLTESGFVVDLAHTGEEGLALASSATYDLILLDVMLPERDGWTVLSELRRRKVHVPVVFLTAAAATSERVRGLDMGADDYISKPFAFSELVARVRSVLRRGPNRQTDILRLADLEVDVTRHRARRANKRIELTQKEFLLLSLLIRRAGEVVSRRTITEMVWEMHFDPGTNTVDVHIRRLRLKVDGPFEVKLLHTVHGIGYILEDRS